MSDGFYPNEDVSVAPCDFCGSITRCVVRATWYVCETCLTSDREFKPPMRRMVETPVRCVACPHSDHPDVCPFRDCDCGDGVDSPYV
jgi:hypothetical protein